MEQSTLPISRDLSLERLVNDALGEIERLGYSRRSRNRYRTAWEHLIEFSCGKGLGDQFSSELAVRFLEEYALRPFDWRVLPIKLVHAGRLSDPVSRRDVYEQEQPGLW